MIDGLPVSTRSKIYRRIYQQLQTDPVLSNVVRKWNVWTGKIDDPLIGSQSETSIQITPRLGPTTWSSPDAHRGQLVMEVEIWLPGNRLGIVQAEECLDVWEAFENAIYPFGNQEKRLGFEQSLRDLGAVTGQILFSQPASITDASTDGFYLLGNMSIEIERQLDA